MRLLKLCPKLLRSLLQFLPVVAPRFFLSVNDQEKMNILHKNSHGIKIIREDKVRRLMVKIIGMEGILVMFSPPSHRDNKLLMLQVMIYHASLPAYIKNPDHLIQLPMLRKQFR